MKEPPDKYRTVKCTLTSIIKKEENIPKIMDVLIRTNKLTIHVYQLLRLWLLDNYDSKVLPIITKDVIKMAFKVLSLKSKGLNRDSSNKLIYDELENLYNKEYKSLGYHQKISASYLSQIINYSAVDMLKNIENNIKMNYIKYVNRFVNSMFKKEHTEILEKLIGKEKSLKNKELRKELYEVKKDIQENTLKSNEKYHSWIKLHRSNITPNEINDEYTLNDDIDRYPQKYLKNMIYMCLEIEETGTKMFQFFPLRSNCGVHYIPIDTKSLIEIFIKTNGREYFGNIKEYKKSIWDIYFKTDEQIFKQSNYVFDYKIATDGYGVSIQLLNKKYVEKEDQKKQNMKNKKNENIQATKNMTKEGKDEYKRRQIKIKEQKRIDGKQRTKENKAKFKQLSKEEQLNIINSNKTPYLEDLTKEQIENLKTNNWITIDPGKNTLYFMKSKSGNIFRYTNRTHIKRTKRLKYQRLLERHKDNSKITETEQELSQYNSKTCNFDKFKDYIKAKNRINNLLFEKYENKIFRQYKWYSFLNRKHTETKLVREIKHHYGKDSTIILGDWSKGNEQRGILSTPNKALTKVLKENFNVYMIDEFRTSKLNCKTEEVNENLSLPDKKGNYHNMHSILTYQTKQNEMGCINRDSNAVNNMIKIVKYFIQTGDRLLKFRRDYDLKTN